MRNKPTAIRDRRPILALLALLVLAGALSSAGARDSGPNQLENVVIYNFAHQLEIKLFTSAAPAFRVVRHDERELSLELIDTVIEEQKDYHLSSKYASSLTAVPAGGSWDSVLIKVSLKAPASFSAEVENGQVLTIYIPGKAGAEVAPAPAAPAGTRPVIIDLHNDTLSRLLDAKTVNYFTNPALHAALPHIKKGKVSGLVYAVWVPDDMGYDYTVKVVDIFDQLLAKYPDDLAYAGSHADFRRNFQDGRISAFLSLEGGEAIGGDLKNIDYFYRRGVRMIGILWNNTNRIGDAAREPGTHNGLSPFGKQVIARMNQLGMIIDVSHCSDPTTADVLALTRDPVVASHSCARALRDHYRNLNDDLIRGVCSGGGVIGIIYNTSFLTTNKTATVADVADHIDRIRALGGVDCLALGSDYDGGIRPAKGLENIGLIENLFAELRNRGYTEEDLKKLQALNFLRVLHRVVDSKQSAAVAGAQ